MRAAYDSAVPETSRFTPSRPPYGVVFDPPAGWIDHTYYEFTHTGSERRLVVEERAWDGNDAAGWLADARAKMKPVDPSPITSIPHAGFTSVRAFHGAPAPGSAPALWIATLSFDAQFRSLAVSGETSEAEFEALLAELSPATTGHAQQPCWEARGVWVQRRPSRCAPTRFSYTTRAAVLSLAWEASADFGGEDLSPLVHEADAIREAGAAAFEVVSTGAMRVRRLEPRRVDLPPHCFVAHAVWKRATRSTSPGAARPHLHLRCTGHLKHQPDLEATWNHLLRTTHPDATPKG